MLLDQGNGRYSKYKKKFYRFIRNAFFYYVAIINANWKYFTPHGPRCEMQKIVVSARYVYRNFFLIVFKLIKLICELLHVDYLLKTAHLQMDDVIHVINAEINIDCYLIPQTIHYSLFL